MNIGLLREFGKIEIKLEKFCYSGLLKVSSCVAKTATFHFHPVQYE